MGNPPQVFVTGVTGYVGGDALFVILAAHPEWQYTFLVRDEKRVADFASRYPRIRIITGDISDSKLIKRETLAADIILTFHSSDDLGSADAIRDALRSDRQTRFWIHTSGTANLIHEDMACGRLGQLNPKVWDDIEHIDAINQWPQEVLHRPVEKIVLEASDGFDHVKTAVIVPPCIVGPGRGPGNKRTIQVPIMIELIRRRGRSFQVGAGRATWGFVHIWDLSDVYLHITEAAAAGGQTTDWGRQGWYFAENGELAWGDISQRVADRLFEAGQISTREVDSISVEESYKVFGRIGPGMAGANSRSRATRTRTRLGWRPKIADFERLIDEHVAFELEGGQSRLHDFEQGHMPVPAPRRARTKM